MWMLFVVVCPTPLDMVEDPDPLVSVVIPTYFRNDVVPDAIESVLAQTYDRVEVVVVDDSGEAHARPVVESFHDVRYLPQETSHGANPARQIGLEHATGRYVNFLDDDDRMFPEKLERQVAVAEANDDVGVVYCGIEKTGGLVNLPDPAARGDVLVRTLTFDMWPCMTSTMLVERDLLGQITPFAVRSGGDDLDMMIRLAQLTHFDFVDAPLLYKRMEQGSRGNSVSAVDGRFEMIEDYAELYASFPMAVHDAAIANTYESLGELLLLQNPWSARAIVALAKTYYYSGWTDPKALVKLVASLFGRPGWRVVRYIGQSTDAPASAE